MKIFLGGAAALIGLAVAWVLISPLFFDDEVDEAFPTAAVEAPATPAATDGGAAATEGPAAPSASRPEEAAGTEEAAPAEPAGPVAVLAGRFRDADDVHKGSGDATIYETGSGRVLRFENFRTTNGPDLRVWLSKAERPQSSGDVSALDRIDLGELKGNVGNQNYDIPEDVDLSEYRSVVIWCRAFGVLFATADLEAV